MQEEKRRLRYNAKVEAAQAAEMRREHRAAVQRARAERRRRSQMERAEMLAEAERERRERWVQRELRSQRNAMKQLVHVRSLAELAAEAAAQHKFACQRARVRDMKQTLRAELRGTSTGLCNDFCGSARANMLVRRARYLFGRTHIRHLFGLLGLASSHENLLFL